MYCGPRGSPAAHISSRTTACCHTEPSAPPCSAGQLSVSQPRAARCVAELAGEGHGALVVDEHGLPPRGQLVVEERAQLGAERLFLGGEVEVHRVTTLPRRAGTRRARRRAGGRTRRRTAPTPPRPRRRPPPAPRRLERGHREVEDHVVVRVLDALHPAEEAVDDDLQPGLLVHLAHDGLVQRLAPLHVTAGHRPLPLRRSLAPPDQQQRLQVGARPRPRATVGRADGSVTVRDGGAWSAHAR